MGDEVDASHVLDEYYRIRHNELRWSNTDELYRRIASKLNIQKELVFEVLFEELGYHPCYPQKPKSRGVK